MEYLSIKGEKELWTLNLNEFRHRKRRGKPESFAQYKNLKIYGLAKECGQKCSIKLNTNRTSINAHQNFLNIHFTQWNFYRFFFKIRNIKSILP